MLLQRQDHARRVYATIVHSSSQVSKAEECGMNNKLAVFISTFVMIKNTVVWKIRIGKLLFKIIICYLTHLCNFIKKNTNISFNKSTYIKDLLKG